MNNKKALFIPATIYQAKGQTSTKWYVYYSYWDESKLPEPGYARFKVYEEPEVGLVRGNRISDYSEKIKYFTKLATHINNQLSNGWSPFGRGYSGKLNSGYISIDQALENILVHKKGSLAETAYSSFKSHVLTYKTWLSSSGYSYLPCKDIGKGKIVEFLFSIQKSNSLTNRTINNYLIDIHSAYTAMKSLEYVIENPAKDIPKLPTKSDKHEVFDLVLLKNISDFMQENLPYLQLYCKFIWMGFRPIEIVRLKVIDVNVKAGYIRINASNEKTGKAKYRPILRLYLPEIEKMELDKFPPHYYLFSAQKRPDMKKTTRDYFTDKFEIVKDHFKLPRYYTMYGLRHTMAVELAKSGESLINIKKITGHTTLTALEIYLRKYMNEPAQDVSHRFTVTI